MSAITEVILKIGRCRWFITPRTVTLGDEFTGEVAALPIQKMIDLLEEQVAQDKGA